MLFAVRPSLSHLAKTTLFEKKSYFLLRCGSRTVKKQTIRQNSVFFRLMDFIKWIVSGVLIFSVFDIQNKNSYTCKKVMQVLTGQYPTLYTHKFRLFHTDFTPDGVRNGFKYFLTLKPTYEVFAVKIKQSALFTGPTTPIGSILICQFPYVTYGSTSTMPYLVQTLNQDINPVSGSLAAAGKRTRQYTTPVYNLIGNQSIPYQLICLLSITSGSGVAALTGGAIDIWVTTIKMP